MPAGIEIEPSAAIAHAIVSPAAGSTSTSQSSGSLASSGIANNAASLRPEWQAQWQAEWQSGLAALNGSSSIAGQGVRAGDPGSNSKTSELIASQSKTSSDSSLRSSPLPGVANPPAWRQAAQQNALPIPASALTGQPSETSAEAENRSSHAASRAGQNPESHLKPLEKQLSTGPAGPQPIAVPVVAPEPPAAPQGKSGAREAVDLPRPSPAADHFGATSASNSRQQEPQASGAVTSGNAAKGSNDSQPGSALTRFADDSAPAASYGALQHGPATAEDETVEDKTVEDETNPISAALQSLAERSNSATAKRDEPLPLRLAHGMNSSETVGSAGAVSRDSAIQPTPSGAEAALFGREISTVPHGVTGPASGSSGGAAVEPRETFAALDSAAGHGTSWIHAGSHSAEAGFDDPLLGWIGVRADLGTGGVQASIVPGSAAAAAALGGHMAGLHAYLSDHHAGVETLTLASPENPASNGSPDQGMQQQNGQGHAQQASTSSQQLSSVPAETESAHTSTAAMNLAEAAPVTWESGHSISVLA